MSDEKHTAPTAQGSPFSALRAAAPHADGSRLLADIGGTHARFALETGPGAIGPVRVYACREHAGLADAIRHYLADANARPGCIKHAAVAIAYPVDGDRVRMTNLDWTFSIEATRRALGLKTLFVVNDFAALAYALPGLDTSQYEAIGATSANGMPDGFMCDPTSGAMRDGKRPQGVIGLLGPGTGLGVAGLVPCDGRWIALASEGGHTSFAPQDAREDQVLRHARKLWPHVSFERVASGPGIEMIYRALAERDPVRNDVHDEARNDMRDKACNDARDRACSDTCDRVCNEARDDTCDEARAIICADECANAHNTACVDDAATFTISTMSVMPATSAADIIRLAHAGDALAHETVSCFCGILGTFAGDLAVTLGARGGIYIGGGIVPRLGDLFKRSPFRRRFEAKGRLGEWLARVPTYVITAEYPALSGVSGMLEEYLS